MAERLGQHEYAEVYAHHDADGIAAGVILCTALFREGIRFRLRIVHRISPAAISPETPTLLCDLGAGLEDLPGDVMVVDHHIPRFTGDLHVNPRLEGIDADRELSAAGAAFLVARHMGDNRDLAGLVMLGIIGDDQELAGPNREIFNESVAQALVTPDRGCLLPGRDLHERLLCAMRPYLHQISGDEMAVADLIESVTSETGMKYDELVSLLILRISPFVREDTLGSLFGDRYILEREIIPDAHTFAAVIDACGKCGRGGLAAALCFRSPDGLAEAWQTAIGHRLRAIREIRSAIESRREDGYYEVEDVSVTGDVADALARDTVRNQPVMVAARKEDLCHVSIRSPARSEFSLGTAAHTAASACGGFGGGHRTRAGATVSCARMGEFRDLLAKELVV